MQLPWDEHFAEIVIPAWQAYSAAERKLTEAHQAKDDQAITSARYLVLREAGAAAFYLHHFAEIVLRAYPHWLPHGQMKLPELRAWLAEHCTMLRTDRIIDDVSLLRDVADALKHAVLSRHGVMVAANDAVIVVASGYGELGFGEGKFGGIEQVLIRANSGTRPLSSILQKVIDAWRRVAGLGLPEIGRP